VRAPMRGGWRALGATDRSVGNADDAAHDSDPACTRQVLDADGHRLPQRRHEVIEAVPTLATSSVWRMAIDRWVQP
jgi:hypothetical protein